MQSPDPLASSRLYDVSHSRDGGEGEESPQAGRTARRESPVEDASLTRAPREATSWRADKEVSERGGYYGVPSMVPLRCTQPGPRPRQQDGGLKTSCP